MKKGIHTLIRLQKRQVDMLRREITTLEERREQLTQAKRERERALARERNVAREDIFLASALPPFATRTKERIGVLEGEIAKVDLQIESIQEILRGQFAELKKYETVRDRRLQAEKKERERREQNVLDEVGLSIFNRREEGE